jgi:hypothetical protein
MRSSTRDVDEDHPQSPLNQPGGGLPVWGDSPRCHAGRPPPHQLDRGPPHVVAVGEVVSENTNLMPPPTVAILGDLVGKAFPQRCELPGIGRDTRARVRK